MPACRCLCREEVQNKEPQTFFVTDRTAPVPENPEPIRCLLQQKASDMDGFKSGGVEAFQLVALGVDELLNSCDVKEARHFPNLTH